MALGVFGASKCAFRDACFGRKRVAAPLWNTACLHSLGFYLPANFLQYQMSLNVTGRFGQSTGDCGNDHLQPPRTNTWTPLRNTYWWGTHTALG